MLSPWSASLYFSPQCWVVLAFWHCFFLQYRSRGHFVVPGIFAPNKPFSFGLVANIKVRIGFQWSHGSRGFPAMAQNQTVFRRWSSHPTGPVLLSSRFLPPADESRFSPPPIHITKNQRHELCGGRALGWWRASAVVTSLRGKSVSGCKQCFREFSNVRAVHRVMVLTFKIP